MPQKNRATNKTFVSDTGKQTNSSTWREDIIKPIHKKGVLRS